MAEIEIVAYLAVFLVAVFFSMLGVVQKTALPSFIAWISWHALAAFSLAFLYETVLLYTSWLYAALGFVFLIYAIALIALSAQGKPDTTLVLQ